MNYAEMMQRYAAVAGLPRRRILPVPLFSPSLSSHWVGLITPVPGRHRPAAGGVAAQHGRLPRARHRRVRARPAGGPARLRRGGAPGGPAGARLRPSPPGGRRRRCPARRPTRCRPTPTGRAAASTSTSAPARRPPRPSRCGGSSRASAATPAGTRSRSPGRCAAGWTGWSAGSGCAGAGGTRTGSTSATPSTSGGSRTGRPGRCCGCGPRCGCPAWPGSSSTWNTDADGDDRAAPAGDLRPARPGRPPLLVGDRRASTASSSAGMVRGITRDRGAMTAAALRAAPRPRAVPTARSPAGPRSRSPPGPRSSGRAHASSWAVASSR